MTTDPHTIEYTVNGVHQGVAFKIQKHLLNGKALFPHILTKNQNFTVNFGQLPAPLKPLLPNFIPIGKISKTLSSDSTSNSRLIISILLES